MRLTLRLLGLLAIIGTLSHPAFAEPVSFVNDVQPILTKFGCNQGACHGAQYGQGGFKLSLRAFDDPADYSAMVRSVYGRRIDATRKDKSLLLTKPLMEVPHSGGRRLARSMPQFETLLRWLNEGAPGPTAQDRKLKSVIIEPREFLMQPGQKANVVAKAIYEDGFEEPINMKASIDSMNSSVAEATPDGAITATGQGETVVMVRYLGAVAVAPITVPYGQSQGLGDFVKKNYIDDLWVTKWQKTGLSPTAVCSDEEFLRRIHLATIATLPAPDDVRAFLADTDPNKREKAIDKVLNRPEYVDFWSYKWGDLLKNNRNSQQKKGMWSLHNWLRASFRDNKPMDQFVSEIITAVGSPFQNGPANFFSNGYQEEWTEATAQTFLGVRLQCAKCHHHPWENISQTDYHSLKAYFARLGKKSSWEFGVQGGEFVIYVNEGGEVGHPRTGAILKPKPLGADPVDDPVDRRRALAKWLSDKSNTVLARNLANRYWAYLMGRGLVMPIDDLRVTNPASNPELLDALAKDLIDHNYDIKHLMRTMMQSRVFQLSAVEHPASRVDRDNRYFTHYLPTRMTAEQMLDAVDFACGTSEKFNELPPGFRAIALPDSNFPNEFLDVFGRPRRAINCECERSGTPSMSQALLMISGGLLNRKIADANGYVTQLVKANTPIEKAIEEIYLRTVSRMPSGEEVAAAKSELSQASTPQEGLEDLLWTLLNTREFQFNH